MSDGQIATLAALVISLANVAYNVYQARNRATAEGARALAAQKRDKASADRDASIQLLQEKQAEQAIKRDQISLMQEQLQRMDVRLSASEKEQDRLRLENSLLQTHAAVSSAEISRLREDVRGWQEKHAALTEENKSLHIELTTTRDELAQLKTFLQERGIEMPAPRRGGDATISGTFTAKETQTP